jgi:hypothetical protein
MRRGLLTLNLFQSTTLAEWALIVVLMLVVVVALVILVVLLFDSKNI